MGYVFYINLECGGINMYNHLGGADFGGVHIIFILARDEDEVHRML